MISLIEHNLGKKMLREVSPAVTREAGENVREEKRERISRQMSKRKKLDVAVGRAKSRRSRACAFDFGLNKAVHR